MHRWRHGRDRHPRSCLAQPELVPAVLSSQYLQTSTRSSILKRHELKQIYTEMKVLRDKAASHVKLTKREQAELDQLATEHDEVIFSLFLPVYYRSPLDYFPSLL